MARQVLRGAANMGLLSDKQQMRFDRGTETFHEQRVSLKPVMAWKPVEISFDDITMEEVARKIGERFKVDFKFVNPSLKACRITATFYMEDDLDQIMTVICGVNQSKFEIRGGVEGVGGGGKRREQGERGKREGAGGGGKAEGAGGAGKAEGVGGWGV